MTDHSHPNPIEIRDRAVLVRDLVIASSPVVEYLSAQPPEQWRDTISTATELGVICMRRVTTTLDADLIQQRADAVLHGVESYVLAVPERLEERLASRNGHIVAPLRAAVEEAAKQSAQRTKEVRELFDAKLDPEKKTSTLAQALDGLEPLLDAGRADSIQGVLSAAVGNVTAADGDLARCVRDGVADAVKPLADEVNRLTLEVRGAEAAAEVAAQTTLKGLPFEAQVVARCEAWARPSGTDVRHVGGDNRPGDVTIDPTIEAGGHTAGRIVIECRDRSSARKGRTAIARDLAAAMHERAAKAAIYVNRDLDGLGVGVGDWCEGESERGPWIATTEEHLETAVRALIVRQTLAAARATQAEVDEQAVTDQLGRIRTALDRVTQINRDVNGIRSSAGRVQEHAEALRDEVRSALCKAEDALRAAAAGTEEQA